MTQSSLLFSSDGARGEVTPTPRTDLLDYFKDELKASEQVKQTACNRVAWLAFGSVHTPEELDAAIERAQIVFRDDESYLRGADYAAKNPDKYGIGDRLKEVDRAHMHGERLHVLTDTIWMLEWLDDEQAVADSLFLAMSTGSLDRSCCQEVLNQLPPVTPWLVEYIKNRRKKGTKNTQQEPCKA